MHALSHGKRTWPCQDAAHDHAEPFDKIRKPMRHPRLFTAALTLFGMAVCALAGWGCLSMPIFDFLARLSYDLPFAARSDIATPEICLVVMDEKSARALNQPVDAPWDRSLHA